MKKYFGIAFIIYELLFAAVAFAHVSTKIEEKPQDIRGHQARLLLPSINLDLSAFRAGLEEKNELHWCDTRTNDAEIYVDSMFNGLNAGINTTLTNEDIAKVGESYDKLFELCSVAEGDSYLINTPKVYKKAIEHINYVRNKIMDEWPALKSSAQNNTTKSKIFSGS